MPNFLFEPHRELRMRSRAVNRLRAYAFALTVLTATCSATFAAAQTPSSPSAVSDPLNAAVPVPALRYESAFARYRVLGDVSITPWRTSNDTVEQGGGWRAYAREAAAADAARTGATPRAPAAAAAPAKTTNGASHVHAAH